MEKLRTLKEINEDFLQNKGYNILCPEAFRLLIKEAVKHIKEIRKELPDITDLDSGIHKGHWTFDDILLEKGKSKIDWIKHFFSITGEDLK